MTCAFAVRGAIKKIAGVETVDVSLNKGLATVKMKPGNKVALEQIWETVRKNGFTPKETNVVLRGELVQASGKLEVKVSGSNRSYDLIADPKAPRALDEAKSLTGKAVTIEGSLNPGKDLAAALPLLVRRIRP